jgi:DNA-binding NarL/FixJ family response regulator
MSNPRKKKTRRGSRQTNKYFHTLNTPLRLVNRKKTTIQENRTSKNTNSLIERRRRSTDNDLLELYDLWLSLSPREQDVAFFTCMGNKNTQIAFQMGISTATVKSYLQNIFNKIGVRSKTELRLKFVNFDFEKYTPYR